MALKHKTESEAIEYIASIKGESFQEYRKKWGAVNRFEVETEFPMFLHIETSYVCNFRCPMCVQGQPELQKKFGYSEKMTTEKIEKILKEASEYGCPSISFQGDNEPFLIKDMPKWLKMAADYGFIDIMCNSNGSVMNRKIAEEIVKSGMTRIRFSLDAVTEETYNKIRLGGNFERVKENIKLLLKVREELNSPLPVVGVNFVKMKVNAHELDPFIEEWDNIVDYIVPQDFMTPDTEDDSFKDMDVAGREPVDDFRCNQPWQRLYIRGNGEITPCCAMFSSYLKIGDLEQSSLHQLWNSEAAHSMRLLHKEGRFHENKTCLECSKSGGA